MPFVRLILIYVIVIFAAVAFFNREAVLGLVGMSTEQPMSETEIVSVDPFAAAPAVGAETTAEIEPDEMPSATAEPAENMLQQPVAGAVDSTQSTPMATAPQTANAEGYDEQLAAARQAYWNGDAAKAEELYKSLAAEFASKADVQGELGNLFFTQRRMDEAAEHFFNAGKLSLEAGNFPQAQAMIGVLQGIAPAKANDLRTLASNR